MSKKQIVVINNEKFCVGELIYTSDLYARITKINISFVMDDQIPFVTVEAVYSQDGRPFIKPQIITLVGEDMDIQKASPMLRRRINKLLDEEERLQKILSQCQKEV